MGWSGGSTSSLINYYFLIYTNRFQKVFIKNNKICSKILTGLICLIKVNILQHFIIFIYKYYDILVCKNF